MSNECSTTLTHQNSFCLKDQGVGGPAIHISVIKTSMNEMRITYCAVAPTCTRRRRWRGSGARRGLASWSSRRSSAICLLLGGGHLLIVLVVSDVVLVSTVGSIGVGRTVVLGVLGTVVGGSGGSSSAWGSSSGSLACRASRRSIMLLTIVIATAVSTTSTLVAITTITAITTAVSTVVVLGWVLLETLVLFLDIG